MRVRNRLLFLLQRSRLGEGAAMAGEVGGWGAGRFGDERLAKRGLCCWAAWWTHARACCAVCRIGAATKWGSAGFSAMRM